MAKPKALHPKVAAAGLGGMLSTVLVWGLGKTGLQVPPDVAAAP
jgi:hypothetical protein